MSLDWHQLSPDERDARLTSLLLGELAPAEAAELRAILAADPELSRTCARRERTIGLLREAAAHQELAGKTNEVSAPETVRLSEERRKKLLARFKSSTPSKREGRRLQVPPWVMPMSLAAALIGLLIVGALMIGSLARRESAVLLMTLPRGGEAQRHFFDSITPEVRYAKGNRSEFLAAAPRTPAALPEPALAPVPLRPAIALPTTENEVARRGNQPMAESQTAVTFDYDGAQLADKFTAQAGGAVAMNYRLGLYGYGGATPVPANRPQVPAISPQEPKPLAGGGNLQPTDGDVDSKTIVHFDTSRFLLGANVNTNGSHYVTSETPLGLPATAPITTPPATVPPGSAFSSPTVGYVVAQDPAVNAANVLSREVKDVAVQIAGNAIVQNDKLQTSPTEAAQSAGRRPAPTIEGAEWFGIHPQGLALPKNMAGQSTQMAQSQRDVRLDWSESKQLTPSTQLSDGIVSYSNGREVAANAGNQGTLLGANGPIDSPTHTKGGLTNVPLHESFLGEVQDGEWALGDARAAAGIAPAAGFGRGGSGRSGGGGALHENDAKLAGVTVPPSIDLYSDLNRSGTVDWESRSGRQISGPEVSQRASAISQVPGEKALKELSQVRVGRDLLTIAGNSGIDSAGLPMARPEGERSSQRRGEDETVAADDFAKKTEEFQQLEKLRDRVKSNLALVEIEARQPGVQEQLEIKRKGLNAGDGKANVPKPSVAAPVPQPEMHTRENAFSTFSLNVSDVSFKLAAASLEKGALPDAANIRSEEFINAFDYRDPMPAPGAPLGFVWERARYPFAHNRDVVRFSIKTAAQGREAGKPLNIVLALDNSGSMERADRVRIIQESLRTLATQLQPQDKISVVTFARTAHLRVDGVRGTNAATIAGRVGTLTPEGGTNLEDALDLAYRTALRHYEASAVNRVVLLTDGAANLGNVDPKALQAKVENYRRQGIALDCFGIGWEGFNDDLLEQLSRNGDGRYGFVNTPEEAASEFVGQLAGALRVAASDVKMQVEFNPRRVTAWRQIGYAKHQLTKEQFRDNKVDAAEIGAAESGNALYVIETNPNGDGPIATVRARFRIPQSHDYREHEWVVPFGSAVELQQSSPALRLAASASAFSEWLAASPFAGEVAIDRLLPILSGVPETYGADPRPRRLEWMIRQARSISGK